MKKHVLLLLIALDLITSNSYSQQNESLLNDTINIEEVFITATKTSVNRNVVPFTVSVISEEEIENSSESALLPVLSSQIPGLFVTERGITGFGVSTGAAGMISIRGVGGNPSTEVLILLNGNPQFMGIMGHPLADAYIASDVERVEVIRGPASVLYGTNAMGGVINIITKEQKKEGLNANARLMYGSYNTQKYMVNTGFKKNKFNIIASFNNDQTDGHRDSSDFKISNGYIKTGYNINDHFNIHVDFSLANFDCIDPGEEGEGAGYTLDITRGMGAAELNNKYDNTSGSLRFFYNFGDHNISDGFHSRDNNYGVVVYQAFNLFSGNTITTGIDFKKYGGIAENISGSGETTVYSDTTVTEAAGYIYVQQELLSKLILNAGFRLEHNCVYGNEPVPTAGLLYHPKAGTIIKASVAKGFRSPTIRELYLWGTANGDLQPERMINYEAGVIQKLIKNRLSFELTVFNSSGDNLIKTVSTESGTKYQNTGKFNNTGIEFAGTYNPLENLSFNTNYSFIHMKYHIVTCPEHQVNVSGTYKWKNFSFNASLQHIQNLYTQTSPTEETSTYTLLNSKVAFRFNKYFDMFVKGENLTNTKYYINYGYPMPGIVVFGGINLHLNTE
jgi:outer membrane cobalamin receptor